MLNLVADGAGTLKGPASTGPLGACTWESEEIQTGKRRDYSLYEGNPESEGYAISRLLTWQSRRVRLAGDRSGVSGVVLSQGDRLKPQNMQVHEPMSLWRYSLPQSKKYRQTVYMPAKHEPGRSFWRSLPAVLPNVKSVKGVDKQNHSAFLQSATLSFHAEVEMSGIPEGYPMILTIEAVGLTYGDQEASVEEVYNDELLINNFLLRTGESDLGFVVESQVEAVEEVAKAIGILAANLSRAAGESGEGAGDGARSRARARFFSLIDDPFRRWVSGLHKDSEPAQQKLIWSQELRRIALLLATELIDRTSSTALVGRDTGMLFMNSALAEKFFRSALDKSAPLPERQKEEEKGDGE